jgi:hypothetical protein
MSTDRPYALCREVVADESQRRPGYGLQYMRQNPTKSTDAPLFNPYDKFEYDAFSGGLDNDDLALRSDNDFTAGTNGNDNYDLLVVAADNEPPADKPFASAALFDESFSSPAKTVNIERIKARDCTALAAI